MKSWIADIVEEELLSQQYLHETDQEFIDRVCFICIDEIEHNKGFAPNGFGQDVVAEIELEVLEIFKVKTYGHYNLQEYRKNQLKKRVG
ncbi:hypothetical protein [Pseudobdellovibrio exovorus]|uniref:Putative DNA-dependent DNA polymerase n=1 Tax=Pseudobdellovibrio exovorus JSS TaxID=1184267 RepID=M4V764_9BACT|nr:hypothetical protein [Pseudobdellovibrio exovorus]AGH95033.1 putative DNA-dependent DNA polymerase [Pseudobdellovibrio exovorus JSS]